MTSPAISVPFLDLRAQYAALREEIRAAVDEVLESQQFILGPQLEALEQEVARTCGVSYGVGVASGTDALVLALRVAGIGPGDEVIVPAFSFIATASAVLLAGATPVFADIEPATFNLDPAAVEAQVTERTRAILPVHLFGHPAEMDALREIARHHGLFLIEDNAQAIGSSYKTRPTGSLGTLACMSFYPTKNLGGYGDAGMIVTDAEALAYRLRKLRNHGQAQRYTAAELGWNSRLDEIQAAVLRVKLRHLEKWTAARQQIALQYKELMQHAEGITIPRVLPGAAHVYHQYTLRARHRAALAERLAEHGIATNVYYPAPLHLQPAFGHLGGRKGQFPRAEQACEEVLSLPIYPEMTPEQVQHVGATIAAAAVRV